MSLHSALSVRFIESAARERTLASPSTWSGTPAVVAHDDQVIGLVGDDFQAIPDQR
jgi:hypothetical protein